MVVNEIEQLLTPVINDMGYELWGCEYLAQGRYSLLRVFIDKADGIGVDDCQQVSLQVSSILDVEDPIPGEYRLEISSPGIPRPLFHVWQYQRYQGQDVQIKLYKPIEGKRKVVGTIVAADDSEIKLLINETQHSLTISDIVKANLTVE